MAAKRTTQVALIAQPVRYVFRERYYPEPPADWPPPREACRFCQRMPEALQAGWRWNGYFYECQLHDDEGGTRGP